MSDWVERQTGRTPPHSQGNTRSDSATHSAKVRLGRSSRHKKGMGYNTEAGRRLHGHEAAPCRTILKEANKRAPAAKAIWLPDQFSSWFSSKSGSDRAKKLTSTDDSVLVSLRSQGKSGGSRSDGGL